MMTHNLGSYDEIIFVVEPVHQYSQKIPRASICDIGYQILRRIGWLHG